MTKQKDCCDAQMFGPQYHTAECPNGIAESQMYCQCAVPSINRISDDRGVAYICDKCGKEILPCKYCGEVICKCVDINNSVDTERGN